MTELSGDTDHRVPPLRAVRLAQGLGLREVARRARIDPSNLSRAERGEVRLSIDALCRVAKALGLKDLVRLLEPYRRDRP
jgi:transcriptional regulator with XRE-family HTH domain